jgi:hypothetical protein
VIGQWSTGRTWGRHDTHSDGQTVRTKQANGEQAVAPTSGKVLLTYGSAVDTAFNIVTCTAVKKSHTLQSKRRKRVYSYSKSGTCVHYTDASKMGIDFKIIKAKILDPFYKVISTRCHS